MKIASLLFVLIAATSAQGASGPVLLDFTATWCGPCRQMRPAVEELVQNGYPVKAVDVDQSPRLAERYQVSAVPTFIVIDASGKAVARTSGAQTSSQLAAFYNEAKAKIGSAAPADVAAAIGSDDEGAASRPDDESTKPNPVNPRPWETVVRIKIYSQGSVGFGSGTIIYSSSKEAIILTCAHIFKLDGHRQARPSQFPNKIMIDLFDGKLRGQSPGQVNYVNESYEGEAVDYDFGMDVGLIRIRPARRLAASRVVPPTWRPKPRMAMITVGCSEGHDATAWSTTILNPGMRGLAGNAAYEAIECWHAPKQGRSGGGLYTSDGYVAGVCDFAEPRGNHGLYATPASIYRILDRNRLTALYKPASQSGALMAQNQPKAKRGADSPSFRGQSPDGDESDEVTIPTPDLLGIKAPRLARLAPSAPQGRKAGWVASPTPVARVSQTSETAETTDLKIEPEADNDRFATMRPDDESETPTRSRRGTSKWRAVKSSPPLVD